MIELIPAIDIIDGKCVRLSQGDYAQKTIYSSQPEEMAKLFQDSGIKRLHVVDLDGAKSKHIVNYKVLERIATQTNLVIDFGGGLKSDEDLRIAFESGAAMVTGGSIAVKEPETFLSWINRYGADKIILGADAKDNIVKQIKVADSFGVDTIIGFSGCPGSDASAKLPSWVTCPWPDDFLATLEYQWNEVLIPYWKDLVSFAKAHGVNKIALELASSGHEALYELMTHDKKNEGGIINFTLLAQVGDVRINQEVNKEKILEALDFYRESFGV